jgi:TIR domain
MPTNPRVFISHSAKEPEARTLCGAIADHLEPADFEVLWDQNLQTSEGWRAAIDEWIWRCDAAVLVLSQAATDSRYVAYEAALLRQRWKSMSGQFILVPIWCPGVTQQLLIEKMGALQLSEVQTSLKLQDWPPNAANDAAVFESTCGQIVDVLKTLQARLHARHDAEDLLIKELDYGTPTGQALAGIAEDYKLTGMPNGAKKDIAAALARRILDFDEPPGARRFEALQSGLGTMMAAMNESSKRVPRIVNLVAPFCWVAPEGAVRVAALAALPPGQPRVVAWRRSWALSERMYVYRGFCTRSAQKLKIAAASDGAGGGTAAILEHLRSVLAKVVCYDQRANESAVTARIRDLAKQGVPTFLIIPAHAVDANIVAEVCRRWPELCVFLFGEELDESEARDQFPGVEFIDPPLATQDEFAARLGWGDCMNLAGISLDAIEGGADF